MDKLRKFESIIGDGEQLLRFSVSFPLWLLLVKLPRKLQLLQQWFTILSLSLSLSLSLLPVNLPRKLQLPQQSFLDVDYPFLRQQ
jgi:hypothetical protein